MGANHHEEQAAERQRGRHVLGYWGREAEGRGRGEEEGRGCALQLAPLLHRLSAVKVNKRNETGRVFSEVDAVKCLELPDCACYALLLDPLHREVDVVEIDDGDQLVVGSLCLQEAGGWVRHGPVAGHLLQ